MYELWPMRDIFNNIDILSGGGLQSVHAIIRPRVGENQEVIGHSAFDAFERAVGVLAESHTSGYAGRFRYNRDEHGGFIVQDNDQPGLLNLSIYPVFRGDEDLTPRLLSATSILRHAANVIDDFIQARGEKFVKSLLAMAVSVHFPASLTHVSEPVSITFKAQLV